MPRLYVLPFDNGRSTERPYSRYSSVLSVLFCHVTFVKVSFLSFGTLFALVLMRASRIDGGRLVRH